jgi:hypothetical protein
MKTFINHHLRHEARLWSEVGKIPLCAPVSTFMAMIDSVKECATKVKKNQAELFRSSGKDFQANIDRIITDEEMVMVFLLALKANDPRLPMNKVNPLGRLQFGATLAKAFQTMRCGEEFHYQIFGMRFLRVMPTIGPGGGTLCPHAITNKAKHNTVNRFEYTCWAPHVNPLFDAASWDGLCFLYWFSVQNEPWPNFFDWSDFSQRHSYVSMTDYKTRLPDKVMYKHWKEHFTACGIICDKVTHQPRRQNQQKLDARNVPLPALQRACGYRSGGTGDSQGQQANKDQTRSYLTTPSAGCVVECAGGDYTYTVAHNPLWAKRTQRVTDILKVLCEMSIPILLITHTAVYTAYGQCASHKQRAEKRLYMAKGAIEELKYSIEQGFLMLASRPRIYVKGKLRLDKQSPCIFDLCKNIRMGRLFNLPVFSDNAFQDLKVAMREAEEIEETSIFESFEEPASKMEAIVQSCWRGPMESLRSQQGDLHRQQADMQRMLTCVFNKVVGSGDSSNSNIDSNLAGGASGTHRSASSRVPGARQEVGPASFSETFRDFIPPAAVDDTLAPTGGGEGPNPRKRKRPIPQHIQNEMVAFLGTPIPTESSIILEDNHTTLEEFWNRFTSYLQLEQQYGSEWRKDLPPMKTKAMFWSIRKPIWKLVGYYMEISGMTKTDALSAANNTYVSAKKAGPNTEKRNIKDVSRKCREKLIELMDGSNESYRRYMDEEPNYALLLSQSVSRSVSQSVSV